MDGTHHAPALRTALLFAPPARLAAGESRHPDVLTIPADWESPAITSGAPAPGAMVLQSLPEYSGTAVAHALYLPTDWAPGRRFPVLIEYRGNSAQVRENKGIGYALSGGEEFIGALSPFVNADGKKDEGWWRGNVDATVAYAKAAVPAIYRQWGGDPARVVLTGYSRGTVACNYIGLHDDEIGKFWCAIIAAGHYDDGHIPGGMTPEEQRRAPERLRRLGDTPQLICGEYCSRPQQGNDAKMREQIQARNLTTFAAGQGNARPSAHHRSGRHARIHCEASSPGPLHLHRPPVGEPRFGSFSPGHAGAPNNTPVAAISRK